MKLFKKGIIYCPDGSNEWAKNSAITPTPFLLNDKILRIFVGFRDENGISRIGYVDVESDDPSKIISISQTPVLDIGIPGTFDDNGVILGDVIRVKEEVWMYYVGFQLVDKVKFLAFTGLAISKDNGNSFSRYTNAPILDRSSNSLFFNAIHSVIFVDNIFHAWTGSGSNFIEINSKQYPSYNIRYYISDDGIQFKEKEISGITFINDEYRIGRPRVFIEDNNLNMLFTKGTRKGDYLFDYAFSSNMLHWERKFNPYSLSLSTEGWDSKSICYPTLFKYKNRIFLFYNGNDYGKTGFGYAELIN